MHEVNVLDILVLEPGAFYVMDRGYLDFARLFQMHQAGAFFVTRAKSNMNARRVYSAKVDRSSGIICDQAIALNGHYAAQDYPEHLRRIRLKDPETQKTLVFLTDNTTLPPLTIAALYKSRWQVELFFKWIKQNLMVKHFIGNSLNAVKSQIWIAVCVYLIALIAHKELGMDISLRNFLHLVEVNMFEKITLKQMVTNALRNEEVEVLKSQDELF
jgi:IS4 transposase